MTAFLKSIGLIFALLAVIFVLIIFPALLFGVARDWKVIFLSIGYFVFFLGTVWRAISILLPANQAFISFYLLAIASINKNNRMWIVLQA